jgi:AcrR family transcriptional regulator
MEVSPSHTSRGRPGGHQLRHVVIVHHQRERILTAVELIAERGYRAVTIAYIVRRAAIARGRFYENFASREDCFFIASHTPG